MCYSVGVIAQEGNVMTAIIEAAPRNVEISSSILMTDAERAAYERSKRSQKPKVETVPTYAPDRRVRTSLSIATREFMPPISPAELTSSVTDEFDDFAATFEVDDDTAWRASAVCKEVDPDAFFPEKGQSDKKAKRICRQCTVRDKCLEYALKYDERHGVWGGMSERERRRMQNRQT